MLRGVQKGISDIGWYSIGTDPGLMPLNEMILMPFLGWKSREQASVIYYDLTSEKSKLPQFRDEFVKLGIIPYSSRTMPPFQIFTTKKPVRVPDDIKGMKLYAMGDMTKVISQAGGTPVDMGPQDFYMSLERGLIEGMSVHYAVIQALGLSELLKYDTILGDAGCCMAPNIYIFNANVWNSLPADIQKIFMDLDPWLFEETSKADVADIQTAMDKAKELGHTFINLTPEEIKLWQNLALPLHQEWIKKMEGMGLPAKKLYDGVQQMITEYPE